MGERRAAPLSDRELQEFYDANTNSSNGSNLKMISAEDLNRELRFECYPFILLLLHKLSVTSSGIVPHPEDERSNGFLYLFNHKVNSYREDGIKWESNNKMNLKMIIASSSDPSRKRYKLKSHKNDTGIPVMRRQTWKSKEWRKSEYKLIDVQEINSTTSQQSLLEFPVLVHYFRKNELTKQPNQHQHSSPAEIHQEDPNSKRPRIENNFSPFLLTPSLMGNFDLESALQSNQSGETPQQPSVESHNGEINQLSIIHYSAPDFGIAGKETKGSIVLDACHVHENQSFKIVELSGGKIQSSKTSNNSFEIKMFSQQSGKLLFCVILEDSMGNILAQSSTLTFFFMPENNSLPSFFNLDGNFDIKIYQDATEELNLGHKQLESVSFLRNFSRLHTLNLHENRIDSNYIFPPLPSLRKLEIDHNRIEFLEPFLDGLLQSCPNIVQLNLVGNPCTAGFSEPHQYTDYRSRVIRKMRKLVSLDDITVNAEELRRILENCNCPLP